MKMAFITSVNLSERNAKVYKRYFQGNKGTFSKEINHYLDKNFVLDGLEHINFEIRRQIITIKEASEKINGLRKKKEEAAELLKKKQLAVFVPEDVEYCDQCAIQIPTDQVVDYKGNMFCSDCHKAFNIKKKDDEGGEQIAQ